MFIFSNLAISLDGKIGTRERKFFNLGTPEDRREMIRIRKKCDALLIGATTFRTHKKPSLAGKASKQPINIIVSSHLEGISPHWEFFKAKGLRRILFVSSDIPKNRVEKFAASSEVILLDRPSSRKTASPALQIVQHLKTRGVKNLLIEGGGGTMWDFVKHDLIDEYHVTLTPLIIGGTQSPSLVDGEGFLSHQLLKLKLKQSRVVGNEIYLIYKRR